MLLRWLQQPKSRNKPSRVRLAAEFLEDRSCPSTTSVAIGEGVLIPGPFHKNDRVQFVISVGSSDDHEAEEPEDEFARVDSSLGTFRARVDMFNSATFNYVIKQDGETFTIHNEDSDDNGTVLVTVNSPILKFTKQPPSKGIPGQPLSDIEVQLVDQDGHNMDYNGPVTLSFARNLHQATLNGNPTVVVPASGGHAVFSGVIIDKSAEDYELKATLDDGTEGDSDFFTVKHLLEFKGGPDGADVNQALAPFTVQVEGPDHVLDKKFNGDVTIDFGANPAGATLGGTKKVHVQAGIATFDTLTVSKQGNDYTLIAGILDGATETSPTFDIGDQPEFKTIFNWVPNQPMHHPALGDVVVEVKRPDGTVDKNFKGNVIMTLSNNFSGGQLTGDTVEPVINGEAHFSRLIVDKSQSSYTFTATLDSSGAAVTSKFVNILHQLHFITQPHDVVVGQPMPVVVGVSGPGAILATDTSFNGPVTIQLLNAQGVQTIGPTVVNAVHGVASFTGLAFNNSGISLELKATVDDGAQAFSRFFDVDATSTNKPPQVTHQPADAFVAAGKTASFTAFAAGFPLPTIQWQVSTDNGKTFNDVANATATTFSFTAQLGDSGKQFRAKFTNLVGTIFSNAAKLAVGTAPSIATNPVNVTVAAGSKANFSATANGTGPIKVQWQVSTDGGAHFANVAGATATTFSLTAQPGDDNKLFRADFTSPFGEAISSNAKLTVNFAPKVTTDPASQTIAVNNSVTFTAAASGEPAPSVKWQVSTDNGKTFNDVPGATSAKLTFAAQLADSGKQFHAVFTNAGGTATTKAATLTVDVPPGMTTQPTNQTVTFNTKVTFTAAASGTPAPKVQWEVSTDGGAHFTRLAGATNATLSFTAQPGDNGKRYRAVFTNPVGTITSNAVALTVNFPPKVTLNPLTQAIATGKTVNFTVTAAGQPAPTVQWQVSTDGGKTFNDLAGKTSTTLSFAVAIGDNGKQFRAVFTNAGGTATTTVAKLTVHDAPAITQQPANQSVAPGAKVTFTAAASGFAPLKVQWQVSKDGGRTFANLAGATTATLSFNATASQAGFQYRAVFSNDVGQATTNAATLTVNIAPKVISEPTSQTVFAGTTVKFTALASGFPVPTVKWQVSTNGGQSFTDIAGATSDSFSFVAQAGDNGKQYRAVFANANGSATSKVVTLTVQ